MRVTLIDGQGNFGSVDGDNPAAMRYTEVRLARSAMLLLDDIDRDTVDYSPNYDETEKEPKVLPARFPNLLINGGSGIAVGMATNIPPHNPGEIIDATLALIANPDTTLEELMQIVPGPDFPTGGIIIGRSGIKGAFETGRDSIIVRSRTEIEEIRKDRFAIIVTKFPIRLTRRPSWNASPNWSAPNRSRASPRCATRATVPACASSLSCAGRRRLRWC